MLTVNKYLESSESQIFNIPYMSEHDESITKFEESTIYEDNHGLGKLDSATEYSYTTNNEDIFYLPSNSYLLATLKLTKGDESAYADADLATIDWNAFNIFDTCRLYLDDIELERIDHVGISTMLYNLTKYTFSENNSIRHSQLLDLNRENIRDYMKICGREIEVLLPLRKMFPFLYEVPHVFRGVKFRIHLTKNDDNKVVYKWSTPAAQNVAAVDAPVDGKFIITKMVWKLPYVEPSLQVQAKLENMLAKNSTFNFKYHATSVYKFTPSKTQDLRVNLSSSIHKPEHIFVFFQKLKRGTQQTDSYMGFDHMNTEYCNVEINGKRFPENNTICDFAHKKVHESFNQFLRSCKEGVSWTESYMNYINHFPIFHIDVSKHPPNLYDNTSFPNIVVNAKFREVPTDDFCLFVVVYNIRDVSLQLDQKKMKIIK